MLYSAKINIDADFDERYSLGFDYLERGRFSELLKQYKVIAIGFVDSELSILYKEGINDKCSKTTHI